METLPAVSAAGRYLIYWYRYIEPVFTVLHPCRLLKMQSASLFQPSRYTWSFSEEIQAVDTMQVWYLQWPVVTGAGGQQQHQGNEAAADLGQLGLQQAKELSRWGLEEEVSWLRWEGTWAKGKVDQDGKNNTEMKCWMDEWEGRNAAPKKQLQGGKIRKEH